MDTSQLKSSLNKLFQSNRIVFWYDPDKGFEDTVDTLDLSDITLLRLDREAALNLKMRLELEDKTGQYLLYAPFAESEPENDWLLDIRLYSHTFYADRSSILLNELCLSHQTMRTHLEKRMKFFDNKERLSRLKKWVHSEDQEKELDLKMLSVLARADQPQIYIVLMKLFGQFCEDGVCNLDQTPKSWEDIEKMRLVSSFWELMTETFGYPSEQPTLQDLLRCLMVTDFAQNLREDCPQGLRHFLLSDKKLAASVSVFFSQWQGSVDHSSSFDLLSDGIAEELKIHDYLEQLNENSLLEIMTFEAVERRFARCLRDRVIEGIDFDELQNLIQYRRDGHWVRVAGTKVSYGTLYDAIEAAGKLLDLRRNQPDGLSYPNSESMYKAYTRELFRFDQLYRQFHEAADTVKLSGGDLLKELQRIVEDCYSGWYIDQSALCWNQFVSPGTGQGLLSRWSIKDIPNQQDFYPTFVEPLLKTSPNSKVFVIISDALRYEIAEEISRELNGKYRFKAILSSQLGVLPSYTGLGMGALLPHQTLDCKTNKTVDILVNGSPTASLEQRKKVLSKVEGTAIKAEELKDLGRDRGRDFVKSHRVIYIYHNVIDAVGDSASSESRTFAAARDAIDEISSLVRHIINNLNGNYVLVTADHGFLFQEIYPDITEKSGLDTKPKGTLKAKKRYLLGTNLGDETNVWHGDTQTTAGTENSMEFWIPKGVNRFHFVGGARFIHGGAMLQEVVVPVINVKHARGSEGEKSATKKVGVSILGSSFKVVNNIQRFQFIQTESISDRIHPRTLLVSLRDGEKLISNEVALTFDCQSSDMADLKKEAKLTVQPGQYDKKSEYFLVLRDSETQIEYQRLPVRIDLAFGSDF